MKIAMSDLKGQAALNLIIEPLWDNTLLGLTNTGDVNLFVNPIGQNSKTLVDTNMTQSGGLPSPNEFYLRAFCIQPVPRAVAGGTFAITDVTDVMRALYQTLFRFNIGTSGRRLVEGHAQLFPCGVGLEGTAFAGGGATFTHIYGNGVRRLDNRYGLGEYAEKLTATEGFSGVFRWPAGTMTLSSSHTFLVYLPGIKGQSVG